MTITARGMVIGKAIAMPAAAKITSQAWAIRAGPFHADLWEMGAHSSGVK